MTIYIVRHTIPRGAQGLCYGQTDLDVDVTFQDEANQIKSKLPGRSFELVYSSPLKRCLKLARELAPDNHITVDHRLIEVNCGDWEMVSWDDIPQEAVDNWADMMTTFSFPNGESFSDVRERVAHFYRELDHSKEILVVAHAGVIKTLQTIVNKVTLKEVMRIRLGYGVMFFIEEGVMKALPD